MALLSKTLLNRNTHRIIYIFFISCLAFSVSLGKFPMSLSLIGLFLNWVIELDFKRKWKKIIDRNYLPLFLAGLFIVELFWIPLSEDLLIGLNVLRIKLPLLLLPIIVGSASSFKTKEWRTIISAFFVGLLISTVWVYLVSIDLLPTKKTSGTIRDASIFMSHLRYSALLSLSLLLILFLAIKKWANNIFCFVFGLWLFFLIIKFSTLTAVFGLFVALTIGFFIWLTLENSRYKKSISLFIITFFLGAVGYLFFIVNEFYHIKKQERSEKTHSVNGEKYIFDFNNTFTENGYYLWENIAPKELEKKWNKVSQLNFKGKDQKGQKLKATLYRFLTSKGLNKDSLGLSKLSNKEIKLIESGCTSVITYNNFEKRIRSLLYEMEFAKRNTNINNQTMNQRFVFWKVGKEILLSNPFFGYGPGGVKKEYKKYYSNNQTVLKKNNQLLAHNQFITQFINLGAIGGLIWIFLLIYSFLMVNKELYCLFFPYAILMFFMFMSDDMLEVQAGVTIFSLFGTMMVFYKPDES